MRTFVLALVFAAILLAVCLPPALYLRGLSDIPSKRFELTAPPVPDTASLALWKSLGGSGSPRLIRTDPYRLLVSLLVTARAQHVSFSAERRLASLAARAILPRGERIGGGMARWHLASAAAHIWVTWNWSARHAIEVHLGNADYGHGFVGLEAASRGYFGVSAADLSAGQAAVLIASQRGPSRRDPWCNAAANRRSAEVLTNEPIPAPLPAPAKACS